MLHGLFDLEFRIREPDQGGDPLLKLNETVDGEIFRPSLKTISDKERKSVAVQLRSYVQGAGPAIALQPRRRSHRVADSRPS